MDFLEEGKPRDDRFEGWRESASKSASQRFANIPDEFLDIVFAELKRNSAESIGRMSTRYTPIDFETEYEIEIPIPKKAKTKKDTLQELEQSFKDLYDIL